MLKANDLNAVVLGMSSDSAESHRVIFKAYARADPETHAAEALQDLKGQ